MAYCFIYINSASSTHNVLPGAGNVPAMKHEARSAAAEGTTNKQAAEDVRRHDRGITVNMMSERQLGGQRLLRATFSQPAVEAVDET